MKADAQPITLTLQVTAADDADETRDRLARELRAEIQDLPVESVDLLKGGSAPPGAKSPEMVTIGSLMVVVLPVVAPRLVELLESWALRSVNRTVKIKAQSDNRSIEVEYSPATMTADELKRLVTTLSEALPPAGSA